MTLGANAVRVCCAAQLAVETSQVCATKGEGLAGAIRSSFILQATYPRSSVTPTLAGPSGRRPPGMWRSPQFPSSGGRDLAGGSHTRGAVAAPPKARLGHPGDVHIGLLKPISFIPWFRNSPIGPEGPYPSQTKQES